MYIQVVSVLGLGVYTCEQVWISQGEGEIVGVLACV